jgi:phosphoglycerate dehydrogenase-like enzyme
MQIVIGPNTFGLEQVIPELSARHPEVIFTYCKERTDLIDQIRNAEVYFGWLGPEELAAASHLRWIQAPSTGVDGYLKLPNLRENEILLTSARGTHAVCLAEHTLAMIFAFTRGIKAFAHHQEQRQWMSRTLRNELVELTGSTLGIIGFGTVGHALAKRAHAFDTRILAVDILPLEKPDHVAQLGGLDILDDVLAASDYLVITVPLTDESRGMIGAAQLARMKPTAILVGVSRGGVIDEAALISALNAGQIAAAALDVFEQEPLPADSPLWKMDNVLITPHAAGGSQFEVESILGIFKENVDRYLRGELPLRNQIDKQRGF